MIRVVEKTWGREEVVCNVRLSAAGYCGKRMVLRAGFRCSLHWHAVKHEHFFVESGRMLVEIGPAGLAALRGAIEARVCGPGSVVEVPPSTLHRFTGLDDCVFFEFSTLDDPADSIRVEPSGEAVPREERAQRGA